MAELAFSQSSALYFTSSNSFNKFTSTSDEENHFRNKNFDALLSKNNQSCLRCELFGCLNAAFHNSEYTEGTCGEGVCA